MLFRSGHNGLKSIVAALDGKTDFTRIYVGIGKPKENQTIVEHVLGVEENQELLNEGIEKAKNALIDLINGEQVPLVMQKYNQKVR